MEYLFVINILNNTLLMKPYFILRICCAMFIVSLICSCNKSYSIRKKIKTMQTHIVNIDLNDNLTVSDKCTYKCSDVLNSRYKYIVYYDSLTCKPCHLDELEQWTELLSDFDVKEISCLFVLSIQKGRIDSYKEYYDELQVKYPVFFDVNNSFLKHNPHIPEESMFHTFLLDGNNNVILVGNPLYNEDIKKLFLDIINKKQ